VNSRTDSSDIRAGLAAALLRSDVEERYDEDIDELELVLPGSAGRGGRAVLVNGDVHVRLDVDTGAPLSVIIPGFSSWVERQRARKAPGATAAQTCFVVSPGSPPPSASLAGRVTGRPWPGARPLLHGRRPACRGPAAERRGGA
jgi:hypothetical protein